MASLHSSSKSPIARKYDSVKLDKRIRSIPVSSKLSLNIWLAFTEPTSHLMGEARVWHSDGMNWSERKRM